MEHAHNCIGPSGLIILGLLGLLVSRGKGFAFFILLLGLIAI